MLDEVERLMGYGSVNFTKSLVETYRRLAEKDLHEGDIEQVRSFGEQINFTQSSFLRSGKPWTISPHDMTCSCLRKVIVKNRNSRLSDRELRSILSR